MGLRGLVPAVDAIDSCNAGVLVHAPACCVALIAAAGADVCDCCTAGVIARVPSPCAARDRCTTGILARTPTLCGGAGAAAAAEAAAGIVDGDAVDVAAMGGAGRAAWHGFVSMLSTWEKIAMIIDDQSPPHMPAPELPSSPANEFVLPDSYHEVCEDEHGDMWFNAMGTEYDGLYRAGAFGAVMREVVACSKERASTQSLLCGFILGRSMNLAE